MFDRENWVSDFSDAPAFDALDPAAKGSAGIICEEFLKHAGEFSEEEIRNAFFDHLTRLPLDARPRAPEVVAAFLGSLEDAGRVSGGRGLGAFVAALAPAFDKRCAPEGGARGVPLVRAAPKISRNDPCPCGSGRKYKKCCGTS